MAFKPNYGRDRAERQRAARARTEEKQKKKDEKAAQRKAEHTEAEPPPEDQSKASQWPVWSCRTGDGNARSGGVRNVGAIAGCARRVWRDVRAVVLV